MTMNRILVLAALAGGLSACAGKQQAAKPTTDVVEAAPAVTLAVAPPAAEPAAPAPEPERCALVRVQFAFDSAQLDPAATEALREGARCIASRRPPAILVEGHTDDRGTTAYNIALGARRAEVVRRYLADLGVAARIETVSFGEELPLAAGADERSWSQNRRAELRLPGDARSDGGTVALP